MKITIEFETSNADFSDDFKGAVRAILVRAKLHLFEECHWMRVHPKLEQTTAKLMDRNGNTVGKVVVER